MSTVVLGSDGMTAISVKCCGMLRDAQDAFQCLDGSRFRVVEVSAARRTTSQATPLAPQPSSPVAFAEALGRRGDPSMGGSRHGSMEPVGWAPGTIR